MAKKKSSLASYKRKVASRKKRRRNPTLVGNPGAKAAARAAGDAVKDLAGAIVPGIASYAAVRVTGRIAYGVTRKSMPRFSKHAGPLASTLTALGAIIAANKVERLMPYHDGIVVGAGIGAIQSVLQTYIPQYGWILNDYHLEAAKSARGALPESEDGSTPAPESVEADDYDISDIVEDDDYGSLSSGWAN